MLFATGFATALLCGLCWNFDTDNLVKPEVNHDIPAPIDVQEQLVKLGYDISVDGKIGKETKQAWEKAYCNQQAEKHFN